MSAKRSSILAFISILGINSILGGQAVRAQQEIGFSEKFALASDRREALSELIPGTDEYYAFHCLHYQNEGQLPEAQAILDAWRAQVGAQAEGNAQIQNMLVRQHLLGYGQNPQRALQTLREQLGLQLNHPAPARDQAATLANQLDNAQLAVERLLEQSLANDRSLGQLETAGLPLVLDRPLSAEQLRALLSRLPRADLPRVVDRIAEELKLKDSRGFGWAAVHGQLTLTQLDQLQKLVPELLESDSFVRQYTARLAPPGGTSLSDRGELRSYLNRLRTWTQRLPASQNSFKAQVLGNLLRLDVSEGKYDRKLFLEYLALPRSAGYYDLTTFKNRRVPLAELEYTFDAEFGLPPVGNDDELVQRYLEHFLQSEDDLAPYANYLKREYLERVLAETRILHAIGDPATWYAKLTPLQQKALRERIELRFAPHNSHRYAPSDSVQLQLEIKNVEQLIIKIYEINTLSYYRTNSSPISTALDLDGLVANAERKLEFTQPADLRHVENIDFPELSGRGVWVVDLLGGGKRSRALIQKGQLFAVERLGDAGQAYRIVDEVGQPVESAHIELNGRVFRAGERGEILLPYAEKHQTRNLLLVDDNFATQQTILNQQEQYQLQAGFVVDRQALIAGKLAQLVIRARLTCNQCPIQLRLLEDTQLTITATDSDGVATSQTLETLELADSDEYTHEFLVPQRLVNLEFRLSGRVYNRSQDLKQELSAEHQIACNAISRTAQIGDFYLQASPTGYRLLVLGRNGEPLPRFPVTVQAKLPQFTQARPFQLATDANGTVQLGMLDNVTTLQVTAADMQGNLFDLTNFERQWPAVIQLAAGQPLELPLGKQAEERSQFSLFELRQSIHFADHADRIEMQAGSLRVRDLAAGDYLLQDHLTGQNVRIAVVDAEARQGAAVGKHRVMQTSPTAPLVIRDVKLEGGQLVIQVAGSDAMTRVHVVANPLFPSSHAAASWRLKVAPVASRQRRLPSNLYVDSLLLDEEYRYILDRQGLKKFPGNLLPQPTLLINPWEVSVTENQVQEAAPGDAMPAMAAPETDAAAKLAEGEAAGDRQRRDWTSFDFLASGATIAANLGLEEGVLRIPVEQLAGFSTLTIVAVHPTGLDSRRMTLPTDGVPVRDQRLREAFDSQQHLAQTQRVQLLPAGQQVILGDARTRRLQTYTSIGGVYQLYATLLSDANWEKFRFVTKWHQLTPAERLAHYNEQACHELDFFLYHKDRPFFDRVVRPLLEQKLDKQIVDRWLLGLPLDAYVELWRLQRLNTLERVLLAAQLESARPGTRRWLEDYLSANPIDPQWRRARFEAALRGSQLEGNVELAAMARFDSDDFANTLSFGAVEQRSLGRGGSESAQRSMREKRLARSAAPGAPAATDAFFFSDRESLAELNSERYYQTLDKTREWAETQYYRTRLSEQTAALIPANPFWRELLDHAGQPFLSEQLDLPCANLHEALCALAVLDLPLDGQAAEITVEENQLVVNPPTATIVFLESIEASQAGETTDSILVGQDIYLASPSTNPTAERPVQDLPLLSGVPYRASVVVTNPTSTRRLVQVLTQLPAGSVPLSGSKLTNSTPIQLEAYSTAKVEYQFYFPAAGEFEHYGAQVSDQGVHVAATDHRQLRVLAEPEQVDQQTWAYIADWGTPPQVLEFLQTHNLQEIDLGRIAFRMRDADFFRQVTEILAAAGVYHPALWGYAVLHNAPEAIEQLLQNHPEFVSRLGPVFDSPLITLRPQEQMSYEHLDYRPLVIARSHQLGATQKILNPSLHRQYLQLLQVISHQRAVDNEQCLQLCYYMLLQNRIEEALQWFERVEAERLATRLQYDYFAGYLDFYRGDYQRAASIAARYADYPINRWQELFAQITQQVREREALLAGESLPANATASSEDSPQQRILADRRDAQHQAMASASPVLNLSQSSGRLMLQYRHLETVVVNYYLMDIELLFSRNPFVAQGDTTVPVIQPNHSVTLALSSESRAREIEIPAEIRNRNVLVEVTAAGISRSTVVTANSLVVHLMEQVGRLQVVNSQDRQPLTGAYVKVYARHADGNVRFYKDGYTDLRGQFDYASLSTSDLDTVQKLSILVLDETQGAVVQEALPPTR